MSKMIRLTDSFFNECRGEFDKALSEAKLSDGKFSFTKLFPSDDRKATVYFTAEAWAKIVVLIDGFDKEVAWHGVAYRGEDEEENSYYITDIVVYPQEVSGTTVEMDTEKYAMWLAENAEDDRFNNIHMQGHSHVRMGTTPSGVDLTHQEEILNMLGDDDFYIFMIYNKSFERNCKVYDMKKNALFENGDVTIKLVGEDEGLREFYEAARSMVTDKYKNSYTTPYYQGNTAKKDEPADGKPAFSGVSSGPYNPVSKLADKPRTRIVNDVSGQLSLPDADDVPALYK